MLDFLRRRKRSWVIVFLVGIIVIVFVLWGVGSYMNEPRFESVAEVNGEEISRREFEVHYQRLVELYRDLFKGAWTQETLRSLNLRSNLLDDLIQRRLLLQEASRLGLEVSDEELSAAIAAIPDFHVNGRFSKNRYLQVLRSNRLAPGQFEQEQRQQLAIQKLYDIIQDTVQVSETEVRERYRLEQEKVSFYFIRLSVEDFMSQVKVSEEEIQSYYRGNRETLKVPLRVQAEYLVYPFDQFSSKVEVSEKEIAEFYQIHRETRFREPKAVRLRHILLRVPEGADPKEKERVRSKAESVLREARAGKDFAQLAKEYSGDPSAAKGGDIGFFTQGQLLPPLEKAAFALKKGETSQLVETTLGYHILKVEEIREEKSKSLKEATDDIVRTLRAERGRSEAGKAVDSDREKAVSRTDFSLLAKERGIPMKLSPFFSPNEVLEDVGPVAEFYKAAFSLAPNEISTPIDGGNAYYLLKLRERKEPFIPPLEAVRPDLEKRLKETKAFELVIQKAEALLGKLKQEKDVKRVAKKHGLSVEETGYFLRSAPQIPKVGLLQELRPGGIPISAQQPIAARVYTQKGAAYVFAFKESQGADMKRFEKEKRQIVEQALTEKRQRALQRFVESLKAKARIEINESVEES